MRSGSQLVTASSLPMWTGSQHADLGVAPKTRSPHRGRRGERVFGDRRRETRSEVAPLPYG